MLYGCKTVRHFAFTAVLPKMKISGKFEFAIDFAAEMCYN